MKYTPFLIGLLMFPSSIFAAPLTLDQANSLVSVVKSSPTTPASAFVPLITAFSSITTTQATTLIEVIQASPTTPPDPFVNMLLAFTVDPVPTIVIGSVAPVQPSAPVDSSTPTTTPVVQSPVMTPELIVHDDTLSEFGKNPPERFFRIFVKDAQGNFVLNPASKVELVVNGEIVRTSSLNVKTTFNPTDKVGDTPGAQIAYKVPEGATVVIRAEGMEKAI